MATKTDNASTFRIVAGLAAISLLVAAGFGYLQAGGGDQSGTELAALSQALPAQASRALDGEPGAFDALDRSVKRVASLRRGGAPGSSADWQQLESRAAAVLAGREPVEVMRGSASRVGEAAVSLVSAAEALLDRSGSTAAIQEFQQRADHIHEMAERLPAGGENAIRVMTADTRFLRDVANGLAGERSSLDIRPLNAEGRQTVLEPVQTAVATIETELEALGASIGQVTVLVAAQSELAATADGLLSKAFGRDAGGAGLLPGPLANAWIPVGAAAVALLCVLVLLLLHSKGAVFERMAKEQAEQNERNQQAILRLLDEMGSLADGDLTVEATVTEDITGTIADSFNFAIEELRKLVATVNETALMVDSATKQTENTAAHLAKAADNQAREINAATESIVSMAASIEEVSGNAERSSDVARHSVEVAHKGGEAVRRTIDGMNAIRETIQETSKRIKRLGESSQEIGNIVELINDIAEQTNILALNASIQASMAGEAGRGFAVVADEVQRLAERSTNATKQIEVLVRTIQTDTNEAVVSMERSTTDVVGGALLAENAGAALDEIEQVSNQIASLVQNISSSAREQAGAAADVTRRTTRLREIATQTGKATTITAASIAKLSALATQLRKTVEGFTLPAEMMQASALTRTGRNPAQARPAPAKPKPKAKAG